MLSWSDLQRAPLKMPFCVLCRLAGLHCCRGDVIGCLADFTQSPASVSFTVNGQDKGMAFSLPEHMKGRSNALFPAVCLKAATASINFGDQPLKQLPRSYTALSKAPAEALTTGTTVCKLAKTREASPLAGFSSQSNTPAFWEGGLWTEDTQCRASPAATLLRQRVS